MTVRVRENEMEKDEDNASSTMQLLSLRKKRRVTKMTLRASPAANSPPSPCCITTNLLMPRRLTAEERRTFEIERKKTDDQFYANLEALHKYSRQHGVFVFCLDKQHMLSVLSEGALVIGILIY